MNVSVIQFEAPYLIFSKGPGCSVEADDREKGCDFQPTDEQLLICDEVYRQRATCGGRQEMDRNH